MPPTPPKGERVPVELELGIRKVRRVTEQERDADTGDEISTTFWQYAMMDATGTTTLALKSDRELPLLDGDDVRVVLHQRTWQAKLEGRPLRKGRNARRNVA